MIYVLETKLLVSGTDDLDYTDIFAQRQNLKQNKEIKGNSALEEQQNEDPTAHKALI